MSLGKLASILLFITLLLPAPCRAESMPVMVSILPLKYFTERIGGDRVQVSVMVQPGASPATYEPKPRQMAELARAQLYVAIGVPFEKAWLPRMQSANPDMAIVDASTGIKKRFMKAHHHGHDDHHDEAHNGTPDPHVWNSPVDAKKIADTILNALIKADPKGSPVYQKNFTALIKTIDGVDTDLRKLLTNRRGAKFLVYHPSWGYFARDYGLIQIPVELEGKEPGPKELAQVIRMAEKNAITVVFAQPQFSEKSARIIANAIHGRVVLADPLAENWPDNMRRVGREMAAALR